jgi:hypothetical protein
MSIFSEYLKSLISEKDFTIRSLASLVDIPYPTLTKLCDGSRGIKKQKQNVLKIAAALMLTPDEKTELMHRFEEEAIGGELYRSRMNIKKLIENMTFEFEPTSYSPSDRKCRPFMTAESRTDVYSLMDNFLSNAFSGESGITALDLLFRPSDPVIVEKLRQVLWGMPVAIRHIIPLKTAVNTRDRVCADNIQSVANIMPLLFNEANPRSSYQPCYFYDRYPHIGNNEMDLSNVMISRNRSGGSVLLCSDEFDKAILVEEAQAWKFAMHLFAKQFSRCRSLSKKAKDLISVGMEYFRILESAGDNGDFYVISWQPCLQHCFRPEYVRIAGISNIPGQKQYLDWYFNEFSARLNRKKHYVNLFSEEGLIHFAKTGILFEIPTAYMPSGASPEMRRILLESLAEEGEKGNIFPHIIKEDCLKISPSTEIAYFGAETIMISSINNRENENVCFIEELSTCWSMIDFITFLEESDWVLTTGETCRKIHSIIQEYLPEEGR